MITRLLLGWLPKLLLGFLDRWGWRQAGVESERRRRLEEAIEKGKAAREAARKARNETSDMDDDAVRERLRKRIEDWGL